MKKSLFLIAFAYALCMQAQDSTDYYYQIPDYPSTYNAATVSARLVDGLGFRFYWGTQGLLESDLSFRPGEGARSSSETVDHIVGLVALIKSTVFAEDYIWLDTESMNFEEKRKNILLNLQVTSEKLRSLESSDVEKMSVNLGPGRVLPFWNLINGPIADAIHHTGQIISFRRSSGNPVNPKVSVLMGKVID